MQSRIETTMLHMRPCILASMDPCKHKHPSPLLLSIHSSTHPNIDASFIHTNMLSIIHATMRRCVNAYVHPRNRAFMLSRLHSPCFVQRIHSRVSEHSCIHISVHQCIRTYMLSSTRPCILCVHAFLQPCFRSALLSSNHAPIYTCNDVFVHPCIHTFEHPCVNARMRRRMHAFKQTCVHAFKHQCIHMPDSMQFNVIQFSVHPYDLAIYTYRYVMNCLGLTVPCE